MTEPGRQFSNENQYRYGFQTQEKSTEINESSFTAEFWQYDARLGRRWNVDPVVKEYESPYLAFAGNPIWLSDIDGADTTKPSSGSRLVDFVNDWSTGKAQKDIVVGAANAGKDAVVGAYDFVRRDAWKGSTYKNFALSTAAIAGYNSPEILSALDNTFGTDMVQRRNAVEYNLTRPWSTEDWSYNITTLGISFFGPKVIGKGLSNVNLVNKEGFLFGSIGVKTPINIPVQRFGSSMSVDGIQPWGINVGANKFVARTFFAIKEEWNDLSIYTTGVIPKGTHIKIGIVGPQGLKYPGGLLQFNLSSKNVVNQSTQFTLKSGYVYRGSRILK